MLTIPPHIDKASVHGAAFEFEQSVKALKAARRRDAPTIGGQLYNSTNQCTLAFSAGTIEWIAWRLHPRWDMQTLFDFAESLWAAQIDPAYAKEVVPPQPGDELASHYIWMIWNSSNAQREKLAKGISDEKKACSLASIAKSIMPAPRRFSTWSRKVLERLRELYPVDETAREDRLQCNGPPIPRVVMDTSQKYDPKTRDALLDEFLKGLDPSANPFLATPQEMKSSGFAGTPYEFVGG